MGSTKINPTPGVSYKNEEEAQKAELEIAQDTWRDNSVAEKATNNPNEMYGGDIQDAVHVDKTLPKVKTQIDLSGAINSDTTSALAAGKEQLNLSPEAQSIAQAYYSPIKDLSKKTEEMVKARDAAKAQDEVAQRRGRSMKMIAGISDGLASLANLIGVGQGGTNIDLGAGSLNPLSQKLEAARLERKADIKSIDDRLEQARQQMLQMQLAKGKDVAAAEERERERKLREDAEIRAQEFQEKLLQTKITADKESQKAAQEFQASENEQNRKHQQKLTDAEIQGRKDIARLNNEAEANKYQIQYGTGGGKDNTPFVLNDPTTGEMRSINIKNKSIDDILATYLPMALKLGEISQEEADDAKNWRSNEVSRTNLLGMVNKSKIMREALLLAAGEKPYEEEKKTDPVQTPAYNPNAFLYQAPSWENAYPDPSQK